jgi:hypothetical protein
LKKYLEKEKLGGFFSLEATKIDKKDGSITEHTEKL